MFKASELQYLYIKKYFPTLHIKESQTTYEV